MSVQCTRLSVSLAKSPASAIPKAERARKHNQFQVACVATKDVGPCAWRRVMRVDVGINNEEPKCDENVRIEFSRNFCCNS